ncbi:MAG: hypothetical protein U0X91_14695 [Spirosomataceae bacterium]
MRSIVGVVVATPKAVVKNRQSVIVTELVEQIIPRSFGEAKALSHLAGRTGRFGFYQIVGSLYQYKRMRRRHEKSEDTSER